MKRLSSFIVAGLIGTGLLSLGYLGQRAAIGADEPRQGGPVATAAIQGAGDMKDKIKGSVEFVSKPDGVQIIATVDGLTPGKHGFHIHVNPDLSAPDLSSAGGHFNPGGHKHGGPESEEHHAGDLGNLVADDKGHAHLDMVFKGLTIEGKADGVVGHSVIIHEGEDDLTSDPAGKSGKRIAGGAITLGKGGKQKISGS